jgi:hypothetical protein
VFLNGLFPDTPFPRLLAFKSRSLLQEALKKLPLYQRKTQVKSDYRKKAEKLDAEYHQPGDATTFKSKTSRLDVLDYLGNPVCFIDLTTEFKYLGSIANHPLTSDADIDKRIRPASAVLGFLQTICQVKSSYQSPIMHFEFCKERQHSQIQDFS